MSAGLAYTTAGLWISGALCAAACDSAGRHSLKLYGAGLVFAAAGAVLLLLFA